MLRGVHMLMTLWFTYTSRIACRPILFLTNRNSQRSMIGYLSNRNWNHIKQHILKSVVTVFYYYLLVFILIFIFNCVSRVWRVFYLQYIIIIITQQQEWVYELSELFFFQKLCLKHLPFALTHANSRRRHWSIAGLIMYCSRSFWNPDFQLSGTLSPVTKSSATITTFKAHLKTELFAAAYDTV